MHICFPNIKIFLLHAENFSYIVIVLRIGNAGAVNPRGDFLEVGLWRAISRNVIIFKPGNKFPSEFLAPRPIAQPPFPRNIKEPVIGLMDKRAEGYGAGVGRAFKIAAGADFAIADDGIFPVFFYDNWRHYPMGPASRA